MSYYADKFQNSFGIIFYVVDEEGSLVLLTIQPLSKKRIYEKTLKLKLGDLKWNKVRCEHVTCQLNEYFNGKRKDFGLGYKVKGTPFQMRVWRELTQIPYGKTATYGQIAEQIGKPGAARAVGQANHRNPIMIVIPCHRCVGADGKVHGESGEFPIRELLLKHEGAL